MHPLVDALIKGRVALKPQKMKFFDNPDKPKRACLVGAIYYGMYKKGDSNPVVKLKEEWPEIRYWTKAPCGCDSDGGMISSILVHLNDFHDARQWPDKKVSDWLEDIYSNDKAFRWREDFDKTLQ